MIKTTFGLTREPFHRHDAALLAQQAEALEMIRIHAQHGGFCVVVGIPGVGKSVLREHLNNLARSATPSSSRSPRPCTPTSPFSSSWPHRCS